MVAALAAAAPAAGIDTHDTLHRAARQLLAAALDVPAAGPAPSAVEAAVAEAYARALAPNNHQQSGGSMNKKCSSTVGVCAQIVSCVCRITTAVQKHAHGHLCLAGPLGSPPLPGAVRRCVSGMASFLLCVLHFNVSDNSQNNLLLVWRRLRCSGRSAGGAGQAAAVADSVWTLVRKRVIIGMQTARQWLACWWRWPRSSCPANCLRG